MTFCSKQLYLLALFVCSTFIAHSQFSFSNELGVIYGPVSLQTDFGERDIEYKFSNVGTGIGIVHFMNFEYSKGYKPYSYFNDHFKVRSEISWNKTPLKHRGKWVDPSRTGVEAQKLRAHTGESNNLDLGMQLEYFPFSIKEFALPNSHSLAPFISLGVHFTRFNPKVFTSYGDQDPNNLNNFYSPWYLNEDGSIKDTDFIINESGKAWSIVSSVGVRYKLTYFTDLMLDLRGQYYFSDKIDGLNHKLPSNKSNDYLLWLNFGVIVYIEH